MIAAAPATREASDQEVLAELVTGAAWEVVVDVFRHKAKALKTQAFNSPDVPTTMASIEAYNQVKALFAMIYRKANVTMPPRIKEIFE